MMAGGGYRLPSNRASTGCRADDLGSAWVAAPAAGGHAAGALGARLRAAAGGGTRQAGIERHGRV